MFFNKGTSVEDALPHTVDFKFQEPFQITRVTSLMKSTSGMSHVCGTQSGKALLKFPPKKQQMVRDATVTDLTRAMSMSVWGEEISATLLTDCRLHHYYGRCLTTTKTTVISSVLKNKMSAK